MNTLTPSQRAAANLPDLDAIAAREAADKATAAALKESVAALHDAMNLKPAAKGEALRAIASTLYERHDVGRAASLTMASYRLEKDPLDFDAIRMVKLVIDGLAEAAGMLGSYSTPTETTPGAVIPPAPARPDDYTKSMQRYEEQRIAHERRREDAMHPIAAIASRNGSH
ncbi:hypothetical protein [Paraburkholderia sp. RL17-373-BIF-A]|uniref:hypothetical protein n=1 Tax=Paraburkholderia sp. RL17-373-BIF-A TaxID=3031629 RepID=UPI0038B8926B